MNKYFVVLLLPILTACSTYNLHAKTLGLDPTPPVTEAEKPYTSTIIARGSDGINEWYCTDIDINPSTVSIECGFRNQTSTPDNSCVQVRFYEDSRHSGVLGLLVTEARPVCSGLLQPGQEVTKNVFLTNTKAEQKRDALSMCCGNDLKKCVMLASKVNQ